LFALEKISIASKFHLITCTKGVFQVWENVYTVIDLVFDMYIFQVNRTFQGYFKYVVWLRKLVLALQGVKFNLYEEKKFFHNGCCSSHLNFSSLIKVAVSLHFHPWRHVAYNFSQSMSGPR